MSSPPSPVPVEAEPQTPSSGIMRGGAATFGAQAIRFLVRIVTQIAIARFLVPADYGLIAMVAPVLALVQLVADLGLGQAIIQRPDIKPSDLSALFWLSLAMNVGVAGVVALLAPAIAWIYHEPRLFLITVLLAALVPISGLATVPAALLSRNMRFAALALIDIPTPIAGLVSGVAAAWFGLGYWALVISAAAESVTGATLVWPISAWRPGRPAFQASVFSTVRVGSHITAFNLALFVTTTFDNILLALAQGETALGLYDKGYKSVTQSINQLIAPVNRIAVPLLVGLISKPDRYSRAYLDIVQFMLLTGATPIIFVAVMARPLMPFVLGPQWSAIGPVVSWLCLGCLASPLYISTYWLFVSQGLARRQLTYGVISSVISVTSFVAGLPWGPTGVAAGAGLSFFAICTPLMCRAATQQGPVSFRDLTVAVVPFLAAGSATAIALALFAHFVSPGTVLMLSELPVAYGLFVLMLSAFPGGRRILRRGWQLLKMLRPADANARATTLSLNEPAS